MQVYMLLNGALLLLISLTPGDSAAMAPAVGHNAEERACDELRRELAMLLRLVYDKKAWPNNLKKLLPHWVESYMPASCGKHRSSGRHNSRPPTNANGVYAMNSKIRHAREVVDGNFENEVLRLKRSVLTAADDQLKATLRDRRSTHGSDAAVSTALYRQKRFLAPGSSVPAPDFTSMSLGGVNPGPAREISESAQMMSNLLMLTKLQKSRVAQEYRSIGRNSYIGDRVSFGSGVYGDSYPGKKKREVADSIAYNEAGMGPDASAQAKLRRKRFMFAMEPAEVLATPSLLSIYQGSALDPNTGKRLEFGGEVMKRAFGSTLMSFLPPGFQPPPGKDPGDLIKTIAPLLLNNSASPGAAKRQNRNGLFGDTLPGKRKRKRSPDVSYKDVIKFGEVPVNLFGRKGEAIQPEASPTLVPSSHLINHASFSTQILLKSLLLNPHNNNSLWNQVTSYHNPHPSSLNLPSHLLLDRNTRSTNSDVVTIGDVTIPVDFFKPHDRYSYDDSTSEQDTSPPAPQPKPQSTKAAQNTRHIHQAYQSIIGRYRQALSSSQYNNLYLYKVLHKPVVHQLPPIIYQNPPMLVSHSPRYPAYLPPMSIASHQRPLFNLLPPVPVQYTAPVLQPQPYQTHISPVPLQPQLQPPTFSGLPPLPLIPPPSFPLYLPPPLPLVPPPPPFIPPPIPPPNQLPPPPQLFNPLPTFQQFPSQPNFILPISNYFPPPPVDPSLQLTAQPRAQRFKRSKDSSEKSSSSSYNFSPSIFPINPPSIFTSIPYIPQIYSPQSNKIGRSSPSGDIIYGDIPLWQHQSSSSLQTLPLVPPSRYPATNTNRHVPSRTYSSSFSLNPTSPLASIPPLPSSFITSPLSSAYQPPPPSKVFNPVPTFQHLPPQPNFMPPISRYIPPPPVDPFLQLSLQPRAQRFKRSKDSSEKSSSSSYNFSPSFFPINPPSIFTSIPYIPQIYSPQSNKIGHRSPSGDIIYGDMPLWQHQSSSSLQTLPLVPPSRYPATNTNRHVPSRTYSSSFSLNPFSLLSSIPPLPSSAYQPPPPSTLFNPLPTYHHLTHQPNFIPPISSHIPPPPVDPFLRLAAQPRAQRFKRSKDSSEKSSSSSSYNFSPSIFPINPAPIFTSIPYIPQIYSPQSNKIGHSSPSGDIIYGDIPLWQHQSSSSLQSLPLVPPSRYPATHTNRHAPSRTYSSSFSLNPSSPLALMLPSPPSSFITSPLSSAYQPPPPSKLFNPLPTFHHLHPQPNFIPPISSYIPPPPVDPSLQLTAQPRAQRFKRSKDSSDKSSSSYNFSPSIFPINPAPIFTSIPYIPQIYSPQSNKIGHSSPSGDIIYGDIPSWQHQYSPSLQSLPLVPPSGYPATHTNTHASSLASSLYQLPASLTRSVLPQLSSVVYNPANTLPLGLNTPGGVVLKSRLKVDRVDFIAPGFLSHMARSLSAARKASHQARTP